MECEVCKKNEAIGVACVPGIPYSAAYCKECIQADAHPWHVLVAETACIGGYEKLADWFKEIVNNTCKHLGKTVDQFKEAVQESLKKL